MHTFPHRTFAICKVPTVNPSGKNRRFLPAPTGREPCGQCPLTISHGIVLWWDTKFFQTFNRQRGNEAPREEQTKTGAGTKTQHPSQSEGSISRWFLPGDSKGGDNSSGSELSPPLAGFFAYFLAGARKYGPAGKHLQKADLDNRLKSCNRVSITFIKYHPHIKPSAYPPLAPSGTRGASSLPEGAIGFCLSTWVCTFGKCLL